ncbi:MAG: glycerophosphodiester phosphodiesterase family protein [Hyphomonadaceae bacterium]|nr:glycerophosphodiester phosphodiesterase family protein [Hyphomonadaceae bacterium]MBC6411464.1 glycerophosphodiester phosphodiesterase family protein [Hyphomonadaceae bacterium]
MRAIFVGFAFCLGACERGIHTEGGDGAARSIEFPASEFPATYPIGKQFACLPDEAAMIAAHRAVSRGEGLAENSKTSLEALINRGILVAEVDIAGLKDGTHILYHDGVWEQDSTGQGAVAATTWEQAEKFLLRDTDGALTADRPYRLADALALARDRIYLEIDFKSSAGYETVIDAVRAADMADRVILISHTDAQARRLAQLAPEMMLSVSVESMADVAALEAEGVSRTRISAWLWRGPYDDGFVAGLDAAGIPVLAWPDRDAVNETAGLARLIVTDYAFEYAPIVGLNEAGLKTYRDCLKR